LGKSRSVLVFLQDKAEINKFFKLYTNYIQKFTVCRMFSQKRSNNITFEIVTTK